MKYTHETDEGEIITHETDIKKGDLVTVLDTSEFSDRGLVGYETATWTVGNARVTRRGVSFECVPDNDMRGVAWHMHTNLEKI